MGRERTEGERRAAEEFANAVRSEAERFFEAAYEEIVRNLQAPNMLPMMREPLTEEEADRLALATVHRDREEHPAEAEDSPPSGDEVTTWVKARERARLGGETARAWKPTPPR